MVHRDIAASYPADPNPKHDVFGGRQSRNRAEVSGEGILQVSDRPQMR